MTLLTASGPQLLEWIDVEGTVWPLVDLQGLGGRMMPPIDYSADVVPLMPGERVRQVRHAARQVVVPILLEGENGIDYRARLRAMARALDPARGDGALRSTDLEGTVRELVCRYVDGFSLVENYPRHALPSLLFRAADPYWRDAAENAVDFGAVAGGSFFPIFPLRLSSSEVFSTVAIDNAGDVEAWPVWQITGPASAITLRNSTTDALLVLEADVVAGDSLTIDTRPGVKSVVGLSGANRFGDLSSGSSLWSLAPGVNAIQVEAGATTVDTRFALSYRRRWLAP